MNDDRTKSRGPQVPPPCDLTLGLVNTLKEPGRTRWTMVADERFSNPAGTIQGGFISAMIDSAMGASVITYVSGQKVFASNSDLHVRFTKAARIGSMLTCEAVVISGGRTVVFVEATVTDDSDRLIARGSSTYHLVPRA